MVGGALDVMELREKQLVSASLSRERCNYYVS